MDRNIIWINQLYAPGNAMSFGSTCSRDNDLFTGPVTGDCAFFEQAGPEFTTIFSLSELSLQLFLMIVPENVNEQGRQNRCGWAVTKRLTFCNRGGVSDKIKTCGYFHDCYFSM